MLGDLIISVLSVVTLLTLGLLVWMHRPRKPKFKLKLTSVDYSKGLPLIGCELDLQVQRATGVTLSFPVTLVHWSNMVQLSLPPRQGEVHNFPLRLKGKLWDFTRCYRGRYLTFPVVISCKELPEPVTLKVKFLLRKDIEWAE